MSNLDNLIKECKRQEESCLYTSTTLYIWLRKARLWRAVFVITPIIFGSIASWSILEKPDILWMVWLTASSGLFAGLIPAIREALNLDIHVDEISQHAAQFKNLQDRFRLASDTGSLKPIENFEAEIRDLIERLDEARKISITPPERCFKAARKKIKEGHYDFSIDKND
jgi:hypothetical protein